MRDYLLVAFVGLVLPFVLANPVLGAYLWAWLSMMNPHKLTYGFAKQIPFAQLAALATLLGLLFTRKRYALPWSGLMAVYLMFIAWMTFTSFFAVAPRQDVFDRWFFVMKIHVMLFVTLILIRDRKHLEILVWIVTFSVAFYGIKGGIWTVLTGGGGRVWGPPGGMLEGNNELAVALVMLMPFIYYLHQVSGAKWQRVALVFCLVATGFSVLGSQSRGALLALLSMAFFLGLKGKNPIRTSVLLLILVGLAVAFMPDSWSERMETIGNYTQDSSAMSRLWTWQTLFNAAMDRPFVGVGFRADNELVFARYAPWSPEFEVFRGAVFVAHSIYFQTLGEHGFVGLLLFLSIGAMTWLTAGRTARAALQQPELASWMPLLMRMAQVSLIGYAVGGAFLSIAYLDVPYYVVGVVLLCAAMCQQRDERSSRSAAEQVPLPATAAPGPRGQLTP